MEKDVRYMSVQEAANVLGCSVFYIRKQIKLGKLPAIRRGNQFAIEPSDFAQFIESLKVKAHA